MRISILIFIGCAFLLGILVDIYALIDDLPIKHFWAYVSVNITVTGYAIYISQMYPVGGQPPVKPEPLSWMLFGFFTATGAVIQLAQGGGSGSWCLLVTAGSCFLIAGWSYRKWIEEWRIDNFRKIVTVSAGTLFTFSVVTAENSTLALASVLLATLADFISYFPTFRKAWHHPQEESATNFFFNCIKCVPAIMALETYSVSTVIYLLMLTMTNGLFALFIIARRRHLERINFSLTSEHAVRRSTSNSSGF